MLCCLIIRSNSRWISHSPTRRLSIKLITIAKYTAIPNLFPSVDNLGFSVPPTIPFPSPCAPNCVTKPVRRRRSFCNRFFTRPSLVR
jgi:hypothetical protein